MVRRVTIRAKLFAAIALTVLGPLVTIGVALSAFGTLGDRFDDVEQAGGAPAARARPEVRRHRHERLADRVRLRRRPQPADGSRRRRSDTEELLARARRELTRAAGARAAAPSSSGAFDEFMALDEEAWAALQDGREAETKRILLGPELEHFATMARRRGRARRRAGPQRGRGVARVRRRARRRAARARRRGDRGRRGDRAAAAHRAGRRAPRARSAGTRLDRATSSSPSACCSPPASPRGCWPTLVRLPEIVLLIAFGALLGPSALDVVDVPLDSLGAQLLFTFGVSSILFYGGLNLSLTVLRDVALSLGLLAIPGVILTALLTGAVAALVFGLPFEQGLLIGAVLSPTDPAILIPLFVASRAAAAGRPDGDRRVGVQRPDRRGARARRGRRAAERRGRDRRAGGGVPRRAGDQLGGGDRSPACCCRRRSRATARASCATPRRSPCSRSWR